MNDSDRDHRNPIRDIYAFNVRPARALGERLDNPPPLTRTSSARKVTINDPGAPSLSSSAQPATSVPSRLPLTETSSPGNPYKRHPFKSAYRSNTSAGYRESRDNRVVDDDDRFIPARRDLLPKPTYSLRGRPAISGARKVTDRSILPVAAARKTSDIDDPSTPAWSSAARKYVDPSSSKSVRFSSGEVIGENPRINPQSTPHGQITQLPRRQLPMKSFPRNAPGYYDPYRAGAPYTPVQQREIRTPTGQRTIPPRRQLPTKSLPRNVSGYYGPGSSLTPIQQREIRTPVGQRSVPSHDAPTPRSAQASRISRQPEMKSATVIAPIWHAQDANKRMGGILDTPNIRTGRMATSSRKSISSISAMGANFSRREEGGDVVRADNAIRGRVSLNMRIKAENEDTDSEMDEDDLPDKIVQREISRAARKRHVVQELFIVDPDSSASSEEQQEESSSDPDSRGNQDAEGGSRTAALGDLEDDFDSLFFNEPVPLRDEPELEIVHQEPSEVLLEALDAIALPSLQMQMAGRLPFLPRQLRRGFEHRCQLAGIPTDRDSGKSVYLNVIYKFKARDEGGTIHEYQTQTDAWFCPLCALHGVLKSRQMLATHLEWDHSEVPCSWREIGQTWRLQLTLPQPKTQLLPTVSKDTAWSTKEETSGLSITPPRPSAPASAPQMLKPTPHEAAQDEMLTERESLFLPDDDLKNEENIVASMLSVSPADEQVGEAETLGANDLVTSVDEKPPITLTPKARPSLSPSVARSFTRSTTTPLPTSNEVTPDAESSTAEPNSQHSSTSPAQTNRSSEMASGSRPRSLTATTSGVRRVSAPLPERYPKPPPPDDPLGPSIQHPFLPAVWAGYEAAYFSCRPDGPRLYDLLNTRDTEKFGVLSWFVIEKEEEMFESDDVRDEDKVMQALWARWIILNRNEFVKNFLHGTLSFIDEYWLLIHRAAGWGALRAWLLVLAVNRFLNGAQVAQVLRYYERLTGMDYWCPIVPTNPTKSERT